MMKSLGTRLQWSAKIRKQNTINFSTKSYSKSSSYSHQRENFRGVAFITGASIIAATMGYNYSLHTSYNSASKDISVDDRSSNEKLDLILKSVKSIESSVKSNNFSKGTVDVVLGAQWGDEGKGKLVDILSSKYKICARVAGGSNAGHTIVVDGKKYKFHLVPSGILNKDVTCVVGNGLVVHLRGLLTELKQLREAGVDYSGRLLLSDRAHIVFDFHQQIDGLNEKRLADNKLGTTHKGIGPSYGSKTMRNGLRIGDLKDMDYFESRLKSLVAQLEIAYPDINIDIKSELAYYNNIRNELLPMITDTIQFCNDALANGEDILVEGANATMIDLDFGTFPYVTSSNPSVGSVCTGLGVPPQTIKQVVGIVKAYCTRVGEGPFPTELEGEVGVNLRTAGGEFGTTTGRPRRCGWIDIPQLKYALMLNGVTDINLTKVDVLTGFKEINIGIKYVDKITKEEVKGMPASLKVYANVEVEFETVPGWTEDISKCKTFDELPKNCQSYILRLEELIGKKIRWIGVGAGRKDIIER